MRCFLVQDGIQELPALVAIIELTYKESPSAPQACARECPVVEKQRAVP